MNTSRVLAAVVVTVVTLAVAAPLGAGEPAPGLAVLDQRISLELRDANPADVFRTFEAILAAPEPAAPPADPVHIRVDDGIDHRLTICLRDVTLRTALQAAAESLWCTLTWQPEGDGWLLVVSPAPGAAGSADTAAAPTGSLDDPVNLNLEGAELASVLRTVGAMTNRKVVIPQALGERTVSLSVKDTPLRDVLDQLCRQAGCAWHETALGVLAFEAR